MSLTVVALGNPGEEYAKTRHNAGRIVLDHIVKALDGESWEADKKTKSLISKAEAGPDALPEEWSDRVPKKKTISLLCMKPETFMNKSGDAVKPVITSLKKAETLVVLHDDLDLGIGAMKVSWKRGAAGHRGVESIVRSIKTEGFLRIRIGISPHTASGKVRKPIGADKVERHILGKFSDAELQALKKVSKKAGHAITAMGFFGPEAAMNIGNTK